MRVSPIRLLNRIAAMYVLLFCFVPPMQVGSRFRLIAVAAAVVWMLSALLADPYLINGRVRNFLVIGVACVALMFLWRLNVQSVGRALAYCLQTVIIILVALIAQYSFKNDPAFLRFAFGAALALVCFYCITTIIATIDNPYASRIANSEWLEDRFEGNENVGLYGYVYMCVFLLPALQYKITCRIHISLVADVLSYVAYALIVVMELLAGYLIAIICALLGVLLIWLLYKPSAIRTSVSILVLIMVLLFYDQIAQAMIKAVDIVIGDNPVYNTKLDGFRTLYEGGSILQSTWYGRLKNYMKSLSNIVNYPILGCYFFGDEGGGGHSTVFDTIGRFGWGIAALYFTMFWKYPWRIVSDGPKKHALYTTTLVMLVLFGILDPYAQEIGLPLFLIVPYIVFMEKHQNEQQLTQNSEESLHENPVSKLSYGRPHI